jgi:hypothetical protein
MNRLKRTASMVKNHLPFTSNSTSASTSSNDNLAVNGAPPSAGPRAWSIAPVTHREVSLQYLHFRRLKRSLDDRLLGWSIED